MPADTLPLSTGEEQDVRRSLLGPCPWLTENYLLSDGRVNMSGWAMASDGKPENWTFSVNGRSPEKIRYPMATPSLQKVFPFQPSSEKAGFILDFPLTETDRRLGYIEIKFVNKYSGLATSDYLNQFIDLNPSIVLPGPEQLFRTQGNRSPERYLMHGFTTYKRLELALYRHSGRQLQNFSSVLDWGCGCGRLSQQLALRLPGADVHGIDIDEPNVTWCRDNIKKARFDAVELSPPTKLPQSSYDLIVGISVMTHLDFNSQQAWLRELSRLARPSAYVILTTHGESALARVTNFDVVRRAIESGADDTTADKSLDSVIDSKSYYRASYHLRRYAQALFSDCFDVIDIIPCANASIQDMAILRAK